MWRRKKPVLAARPILRCSFCNRKQDDVPELIAGPKVFICSRCVKICDDILADNERFEKRHGKTERPRDADGALAWPNAIVCALCGVAITAADTVVLAENRGALCPDCVTAVRAAGTML